MKKNSAKKFTIAKANTRIDAFTNMQLKENLLLTNKLPHQESANKTSITKPLAKAKHKPIDTYKQQTKTVSNKEIVSINTAIPEAKPIKSNKLFPDIDEIIKASKDGAKNSKIKLNIKKAIVKEGGNTQSLLEVEEFLKSIGMDKHLDVLINKGIDSMNKIVKLDNAFFEGTTLPLGHKLKILKKIKECNITNEPVVVKKSNMVTEETQDNDNKNDGVYDEEKAHQEFLEAREEALKIIKKQSKKKVSFQDTTKEEPKKNFLLTEAGGDDWNAVDLNVIKSSDLYESKQIDYCWHCLTKFDKSCAFIGTKVNKAFCSEKCYNGHLVSNQIGCSRDGCSNKFLKVEGLLEDGKWYCCDSCISKANGAVVDERNINEIQEQLMDM